MRNLIQFFTKNSYVFIFLFLLTISFVLLVKNNNYQNSKVLNSSNFLIGNLYLTVDNIYDYFELKEVNKKLAAQNAHLQSTNIRSFEKIFGTTVIIEDTSYSQKYIYLSAKAINSTTNNKNTLTLIN